MRLQSPAREQPLAKLPMHIVMRLLIGSVPDVVLSTHHRREFFGRPFLAWVDRSLRVEPSPLGHGERELIAAAVSRSNRCNFCAISHTATSTALLGEAIVADALEGGGRTSLPPALRATLEFVEQLTREPTAVGPSDVQRAVDAGATPAQLRAATEICGAFSTINRIADALDFELPSHDAAAASARLLIRLGYS